MLSQLVMEKGNIAAKVGAGVWAWTQARYAWKRAERFLGRATPLEREKGLLLVFPTFYFFLQRLPVVGNKQSFLFSCL